MTTTSGAGQKAAPENTDNFEAGIGAGIEKLADSTTAGKSAQQVNPQKFTAIFLNPVCKHDWCKLAHDRQTLEPEGKIIWQCRTCAQITNTYDWQTPQA